MIIDKKQKGLFTGCSAFEVQSVLGQKVCGAESGDGENDFHNALDCVTDLITHNINEQRNRNEYFKPTVLKI